MTSKRCFTFAVLAALISIPAYSESRGPTFHIEGGPQSLQSVPNPISTTPVQQSKCEVAANEAMARHPHSDPMQFMAMGFFYFGKAVPPAPPSVYHDAESGITFYVESDGRHVTAIDASGKIVWTRNPFVDANMCPYRSAHPYISWLGAPGGGFGWHYVDTFTPLPDAKANAGIIKQIRDAIAAGVKFSPVDDNARFVGIAFNSSQFGYLNIENGDFIPMGQN